MSVAISIELWPWVRFYLILKVTTVTGGARRYGPARAGLRDPDRNGLYTHSDRQGAQLIQQRLRVLQVCGVEAFGKPVVDINEHRARFIPTALASE